MADLDPKNLLMAQWWLKIVKALKNGMHRQSVTRAAISNQVIMDSGNFDLGSEVVPTVSTLKTDGPQSVNSTA